MKRNVPKRLSCRHSEYTYELVMVDKSLQLSHEGTEELWVKFVCYRQNSITRLVGGRNCLVGCG